jgi:hypothetical protein
LECFLSTFSSRGPDSKPRFCSSASVEPPRANATPHTENRRIALTTQQASQIASIFDPTVEEDLAKVRSAWTRYQSTRERDAVYQYLDAVFQIVTRWKQQRRAKASSLQALIVSNQHVKTDEPFAVVITCTSDARKLDTKTRGKWSRALRYAERFNPDTQSLVVRRIRKIPNAAMPQPKNAVAPLVERVASDGVGPLVEFIKRKGGINECAAASSHCASSRLEKPRPRQYTRPGSNVSKGSLNGGKNPGLG